MKPPPPPLPDKWRVPPALESEPLRRKPQAAPPPGPRFEEEILATLSSERARRDIQFDIDLFEALNEEYSSKPLVAAPQTYEPSSLTERSRTRLSAVHQSIDLMDKRVLEIGCGHGFEVWMIAHNFSSEAHGIDVREYSAWEHLADERTHYHQADLCVDNPFSPDFFDRILSFVVWEHISHPYRMLEEAHRVLKPGGLMWLRANLYRGAMASHRYREVYFPWPHLLFSDEVFEEFYRRRGKMNVRAAWVNKLTWPHYEAYFERIGFKIRMVRFSGAPFDEEFYTRFEDVLGRYPRSDLERDFFTAVIEKPAENS